MDKLVLVAMVVNDESSGYYGILDSSVVPASQLETEDTAVLAWVATAQPGDFFRHPDYRRPDHHTLYVCVRHA